MIKSLFALTILGLCLFAALPLLFIAVPGILLIIAIGLLFHWLGGAADQPPDNHNDQPHR